MTQIRINDVERQIADQKKILADLETQLKQVKLESPDKALATVLHGMMCKQNHTDGCGWHYEFEDTGYKKDDWTGWAHTEYLKKAQTLIAACSQEGVDTDTAIKLFKLVRG